MANDVFNDVFVVVMQTSFPVFDADKGFLPYYEKEILAVCDSVEEGKKHVKLYSDQLIADLDKNGSNWTKEILYDGKMVEIVNGEIHSSKRYLFGLKKYKMNEINTQMESQQGLFSFCVEGQRWIIVFVK